MKPSRCSTVRISVRLSHRDLAELIWRARAAGLSMSAYLVTMALQRRPLPNPRGVPDFDADLSAESGRPPENKYRDAYLQIRVTAADKAELKLCAQQARCSLSVLLVKRGCRRPISAPLHYDLIAARGELSRIDNNVKQLERLFRDAPMQSPRLGVLRQAVQQFQRRLYSPDPPPILASMVPSLRHFGQELNTTTVLIRLGRQYRLPDQIGFQLESLICTYLDDQGGALS